MVFKIWKLQKYQHYHPKTWVWIWYGEYEYFTSEEILAFDQSGMIEQAKFTYYPLGKPLGKQTKTIEDQEKISCSFNIFKTWCSTINN